MNACVGGSET